MSFATALLDVLLELSPWLLLGTGIAAALHVWLPRDLIHRQLGSGGTASVAKAVALGVPLPLPTGTAARPCGGSWAQPTSRCPRHLRRCQSHSPLG